MVILPCTDKITSFFFNDTATTEIYPLSLHDALPIYWGTAYSIITRANLVLANGPGIDAPNAQMKAYNLDRKSTRLNSSHSQISYAVFCLKKKSQDPARHRPIHQPDDVYHLPIHHPCC